MAKATGTRQRQCKHRRTSLDRCVYCGATTATVCGDPHDPDRPGCLEILARYAHRAGCRLEVAHAGSPRFEEPEEPQEGRVEGVNYPLIRRIYKRKGFEVGFTEEFVELYKNGTLVRMPIELYALGGGGGGGQGTLWI